MSTIQISLHYTKGHIRCIVKTNKKWKQSFRKHNYRERYKRADRRHGSNSALGLDCITASIYKEYVDQLIYFITKIWQASLESGKLAEGTAQAIITPIYGVKSNSGNYRPVALTI